MLRRVVCIMLIIISPLGEAGVSVFAENQHVDLGERFDDLPLKYTLVLDNPSGQPVNKLVVETSCGCTKVELQTDTIKPEDGTAANISIELLGKRGKIEKTLEVSFLHEGKQYRQKIGLSFIVIKRVTGHSNRSLQDHLFKGSCATCHAEPAKGKRGEPLFAAVCGQCHGLKAQGATAIGFNSLTYLRNMDPDIVRRQVHDGVGDRDNMPGFAQQWGGPLTDEQIDSLVDYLVTKRQTWEKVMRGRQLHNKRE